MDVGGWRGRGMDGVNLLPGPHFDLTVGDFHPDSAPKRSSASLDRSETVLVVFIGGVTFSEISALRFLSRSTGGRTKFVIATSHLMNGTSLLKSFQDDPVQKTMQRSKGMLLE